MREMRWHAVCCLFAVCLFSTLARAERELYWVEFDAPASCSSLSRLREWVDARNDRLQLDEHGARFEIVIRELDGAYEARLEMPDGATRQMRAGRCEDLLDALAFIVAVQGDAESTETHTEEPPPPGARGSSLGHGSEWQGYVGATAGL